MATVIVIIVVVIIVVVVAAVAVRAPAAAVRARVGAQDGDTLGAAPGARARGLPVRLEGHSDNLSWSRLGLIRTKESTVWEPRIVALRLRFYDGIASFYTYYILVSPVESSTIILSPSLQKPGSLL